MRSRAPSLQSINNSCARSRSGKLRGDAEGRFVATRSTLTDMTVATKSKHELAAHARRIKQLSHRLLALQEAERREFAEELHERTSPNFAASKINLELMRADLPDPLSPDVYSRLDDGIALLEDTAANIRDTCAGLRPPLLDYAGLAPALDEFAQLCAGRSGIAVQFNASDSQARLAPGVESKLFRIAQEAVTNCIKHSGAKAVNIELAQRANRCTLTIADDGVGFDPKTLGDSGHAPGLGRLNMRERAEFIGGSLSLESRPGRGTQIRVEVSLPPTTSGEQVALGIEVGNI